MGFLISFLGASIPALFYAGILYWLDRYEKEPLRLIGGVFLWGGMIASLGAFILNTLSGTGLLFISRSEVFSEAAVAVITAPVIEEVLKGLAVLFVMLSFYSEFDSILDGIIYSGITALGFAAAENTYYIYQYGYLESSWLGLKNMFILRSLILGWTHPFYTAFTGIGLAIHRITPRSPRKYTAPIVGLLLAIFTHSVHNLIVTFLPNIAGSLLLILWDWVGWMGILGVIIWATARERQRMRTHLEEEVQRGTISSEQYRVAISAWKQVLARIRSIPRQQLHQTHRFFQLCGDLCHKKHQALLRHSQEERAKHISAIREEIALLSNALTL